MNGVHNQLKQFGQKDQADEDIISILEQQLESEKVQDQKQIQKQQISENLPVYQQLIVFLTNFQKHQNKLQQNIFTQQEKEGNDFDSQWQRYKFKPYQEIAQLEQKSIKYQPYSKPFFSQSFFVEKASLNGSFLTVNVNISNFLMKLNIFIDTNFVVSQQIFNEWQTYHLNYLDSGSFSDIFEYFDTKQKEKIVIKKIKFSKPSQVSFEAVIYECAFLKLAAALGIGLQMKPIFGFDLIMRNQVVLFGMQIGTKSRLTQININQLSEDIMGSLIKLHSLNIVHCDIRPQNIEYSQRLKRYVLIDFGLSQCLQQQMGYKSLVSNFKGTYHYASVQMQKLFFSQNKYVDLYFNDVYCLKKTVQQQMSNRQVILNINCGKQTKLISFDRNFTCQKQQFKSIENSYMNFKYQQIKIPSINVPQVLQKVFNIFRKKIQEIQKQMEAFNFQQILLIIKAFSDLQIDGDYNQIYCKFLEMIKKRNFSIKNIQNELNDALKNKSFQKDLKFQGIPSAIEQFQESYFYFQGRSYLKKLWGFYEYNIIKDFLDFKKRKQPKAFYLQEQLNQDSSQRIYIEILQRNYKNQQLRTSKVAWMFFMFLKEKQKSHRNQRLQTILMLQFCLHYCQILLKMSKKLQIKSFKKKLKSQQKIFQNNEVNNLQGEKMNKIFNYFYQIEEICKELILLNQVINGQFFVKENNKEKFSEDVKERREQFWSNTCGQINQLTQISGIQLLKRLKPFQVQKSQKQHNISQKVMKIFSNLLHKYFLSTSWQILFNFDQPFNPSFQFQTENKRSQNQQQNTYKDKQINFQLYFKKKPLKDLVIITSIVFILAKVFYQSSSFPFQQKYNLSIFLVNHYTKVVTTFIKSHYFSTLKFQQNEEQKTVNNHQEYIDFGGFRNIQEKIIQGIQYLFQSYALILDFTLEQDFVSKNCVIQNKSNQEKQKIQIYRKFKDFYQNLFKDVRFYTILKKQNKNEPFIVFTSKQSQQFQNSYSKQSLSLLDSYFQEFHSNKYDKNSNFKQQSAKSQIKFPICLSKFFKIRLFIVCQQISLYLQSLCLKIKTNLKFPVTEKQFQDLFSKIQQMQNYERKQEQKVCVALRYADYLFENENIMLTISALQKLYQRVSQKQGLEFKDIFSKNEMEGMIAQNKKQNYQGINLKIRKRKSSFNFLVIQQNLIRIYRLMKSDKLKRILPVLQKNCNFRDKQKVKLSQNQKTKIENQKIENQEELSVGSRIQDINELKTLFIKRFGKVIDRIIDNKFNKKINHGLKSQKDIQRMDILFDKVNNQLKTIKQQLKELNQHILKDSRYPQNLFSRKFLEQSFSFLTFLEHNTDFVMEKLYNFNSKFVINFIFVDDSKLQQKEVCPLKQMTKIMFNFYQKQSIQFLKNLQINCQKISFIQNYPQILSSEIGNNDLFQWNKLKKLTQKKMKLLKQIFLLVNGQKQIFQLEINHLNSDYDQKDNENMKYLVDQLYYYLRYSSLDRHQQQKLSILYDKEKYIFHGKIINYLLSSKIHTIFSSKRQHFIFSTFVQFKLKYICQQKQTQVIINPGETKSMDKKAVIYELFIIFSQLSCFLSAIQSFPFTHLFISFVSEISQNPGFPVFIIQTFQILHQKQNSDLDTSKSQIKQSFTKQIVTSQKKNPILMSFYYEAILNCYQFNRIIQESLSFQNKINQKEQNVMKTFCKFFKNLWFILTFKLDYTHQGLKKYLIQKRQIQKYFLIINLYQQLSNPQNPIDHKKMILNSFRKIKSNNIKLQFQQKCILNIQRLRYFQYGDKQIKLFSSRLIKKHKKWIQIDNSSK